MLNLYLIYNIIFIITVIILLTIYYKKKLYYEILPIKPKIPYEVTYYNHSLINNYPPDNKLFPKFNKALSYKINLTIGDSLFIPAGWWHWVFSKNNCIAFSHIIHNFDEESVKNKQKENYKKKFIKYYDNNNKEYIDFKKHSNESIPLVYNESTINKISETFLEKTLEKVNLLVSNTNTIVCVNKGENTTTQIINGKYKYFKILNTYENNYNYIGMSPLDKNNFEKFINDKWEAFANSKNFKNNIYLWHSKKTINTGLHYDITDNLLTMHSGEKTVILFPPSETKYLYNELLENIKNYGYFNIIN